VQREVLSEYFHTRVKIAPNTKKQASNHTKYDKFNESGGEVDQGIKGPSFLMNLKKHDFVKGFCIDYMHGVHGIAKLLTSLWLSPKHSKEKFFLATYSEFIIKDFF
jgi:hypothetical protein